MLSGRLVSESQITSHTKSRARRCPLLAGSHVRERRRGGGGAAHVARAWAVRVGDARARRRGGEPNLNLPLLSIQVAMAKARNAATRCGRGPRSIKYAGSPSRSERIRHAAT